MSAVGDPTAETVAFEPKLSAGGELFLVPVFALAMGGLAAFVLAMGWTLGNPMFMVIALVPVLFAAILLASVVTARRMRQPGMNRVEVGQDGIVLPAIGLVRWSEITDMRFEQVVRRTAQNAPMVDRRIGIVPTAAVLTRVPRSIRLSNLVMDFASSLGPPQGRAPEGRAPLGLDQAATKASLDDVAAAIRRHREVRDSAPATVGRRA